MSDFLTGLPPRRAPGIPAPPIGPADLAHHVVVHEGIVHRGAGVALGLALEGCFVIQPGGGRGSVERHLELRPFVFLDVEGGGAGGPAANEDPHATSEAIGRCGEAAAE